MMVQDVAARHVSRGFLAAEELSGRLLLTQLATRALEGWCRERGIADGHIVVRRHDAPAAEALDPTSLAALGGDPSGLTFRRVDIRLAGITLVDAANWYFPERLTPAMRERLRGDTPFGETIAALKARRTTFFVGIADRDAIEAAVRHGDAAAPIFEHRAVLALADGTPLSVVHERYRAVLVR
ncbi:hypothetical protein [Rhodoplanes roseus]|uniref:hypothetical protein n=1 Tax=Rhodoplanes roseus TaxID=29409 RepID=UPI0011B74C6C|nr:hypothetical protein [Rhodoplanes roseus]